MDFFEYLLESQKQSNDYTITLMPFIFVVSVVWLLAELKNKKSNYSSFIWLG